MRTRPPVCAERIGALEALLAEVEAGPPEVLDAARRVVEVVRSWRLSGGELDSSRLRPDLIRLLERIPSDSQLHGHLRLARTALDRRADRRYHWRQRADGWLERIAYQQTFSSTWSGRLGISKPVALEASRGGGHSSAEVPMSLPQIVGALQEHLRFVSAVEPVVVAIDELDKMGSVAAAERFLNEIKAIFGVPNCYFLLSVSEDAVASFERRGLPFRDVVDSSFDEVLRVGHLRLSDAESLLAKRVVSMPLPFTALCHALSGGLARDLIRATRTLFELRRGGSDRMEDLCTALAGVEVRARRDGTVTAVRSLGEVIDVSGALCWLNGIDRPTSRWSR